MSKRSSNAEFDLKGRGILDDFLSPTSLLESSATLSHQANGDEGKKVAVWVPVDKIRASASQPRKFFAQEKIDALAASFEEKGFRGAINVRPLPSQKHKEEYEIVAGERRWKAAKQAGLSEVLCIIDEYTDDEALEFGLVENLLREDLSKLEETEGILGLIEQKLGISRQDAIEIVRTEGHSDKTTRSDVAPSKELQKIVELLSYFHIELQTFRTKNLRTISLPADLKKAHLEQNLSYSSALELAKVKDEQERKALLHQVVNQRLSFRQVKEHISQSLLAQNKENNEDGKEESLAVRIRTIVKQAKKGDSLSPKKRKQVERLLSDLETLLREEE